MAETNPFDQFDEGPAAAPAGPAAAGNPFDQFDEGKPANAIPQTQAAVDQVPDETLPEVVVTGKKPVPPSTWGETLGAVMPTIGSRIESKLAGIQEFKGQSDYADARKTYWQSMILPGAVREAKDANIALTDHPDVIDNAKRLGIRPDVFARDWLKYVNMSEDDIDALQEEQIQKMREGQAQASTGGARRQLAAQVAEGVKPETGGGFTPKSIVFDALTGIPDILAASAATVATGPVGGAATMATSLAPEEYSAAKNAGADEKTAQTYAVLSSMAQAAPEIPVLKIVEGGSAGRSVLRKVVGDTLTQSMPGRVAGTAVTQGVSQAVIQSIQEGIDAGILDEQTSLKDALQRIGHAGLVGTVVGAPLGGMHEVMSGRHHEGPGKPVVFNEEHPLEQPTATTGPAEAGAPGGPGEGTGRPGAGPGGRPAPAEATTGAPGETAAGPGTAHAPETRAALEALQDKSISPPQLEHLENQGLARRNDLGEPFMLPAGRRALAEFQRAPEAENPQTAAPEAEKSTKPAPTGDAFIDRLATDQDLRTELQRMKTETGWAQEGGRLLRTPGTSESEPDKISRTSWIPNADWWRERPKGLTEDQTHLAVDKALNGEALGKRERAMVEYMVDTADKAAKAPQEAFTTALEQARSDTETAPTEGQKKAGNYQKGELEFAPGLTFTMENPRGSTRSGTGPDGKPWSREMAHDYGYLNRTEGNDGEHVDAFLTGKPDTGHSFIVNQVDPGTGKFDEHKLVLGAKTLDEAKQTYLANYPRGWKGLGSIVEMPTERLKGWLARADMTKPAEVSMSRQDVARRKAVGEMTPEEMRSTLLTHELTGLPNRRAYEEAPKLSHQVAIDVDSLKWVNDNLGHGHGDELLKATAEALKAQTGHAYHISGDEFVVQAKSEDEAHDIMREVADSLGGSTLEAHGPKGEKVELAGLGLSYGVGRSLHEADRNLSAHKALREARGERAARGEKPPGATVRPGSEAGLEAESQVAEPRVEHDRVREDQAQYSGLEQPIPDAGGDLAVGERRPRGRNVQPAANLQLFSNAEAPAASRSLSGTHVGLTETGRFASGIKQVKRWQDAAHIFAPLRKSPQEMLMALALDAKGRPLAVLRHSIGTTESAVAVPHILAGALGKIPEAAGVYFGHNHPSGTTQQSQADHLITGRMHDLLRGSGIDPLGMIVVTPGGTDASFYHPGRDVEDVYGKTTAASRVGKRTAVPVLERRFTRIPPTDKGPALDSPAVAHRYVEKLKEPSGILFLNSRHQVVATLPMDAKEMRPLRTGDTRSGTMHVLRAAEDANAGAAITFGHERDAPALANLGSMLSSTGIRLLDTVLRREGGGVKSEGHGLTADRGFYSKRPNETRESLERQFMGKDDAFWHISPEDEARARGSEFESGYSGVTCTGYACAILHKLGPARVKVFGFSDAENPGSAIARDAGGHDFAVVDGRYIVDPWLDAGLSTPMGKDDLPTRGVYDLENPTDERAIKKLYGDQDAWRDMSPNMPSPTHRASIEQAVRTSIRDSGMRAAPDFPQVEVHADYTTLPRDLRNKVIQDRSERTAGAVYDPETGQIHMIAENLSGPREAQETLWHEAVGHHGLRLIMDADRYANVMDGVWNAMPDRVRQTAERNGLDMRELAQRRLAAEEVIAYAAGRHLAGGTMAKEVRPFWQRALSAVKAFVARLTGKPFTDDAAIAGLIRESKRALETGSAVQRMGDVARSQRAETFYSPVERAITTSKQGKASAEQWLNTIRKTPGIKPEELEWLNLEPWLKEQNGPITREQLADYVRANKLELEETERVEHDEYGQTELEQQQLRLAEELRAQGHRVTFDEQGRFEHFGERVPEGDAQGGVHLMQDPAARAALPRELQEKVLELHQISEQVARDRESMEWDPLYDADSRPEYKEFTLPGGANYRELLIRLNRGDRGKPEPLDALPPGYEPIFDRSRPEGRQWGATLPGQIHGRFMGGGHATREEALAEALKLVNHEREAAWASARDKGAFKSQHWPEPDILAHVRTKDRVDADGNKTLFLEEIQSDWHQKGREEGYWKPNPTQEDAKQFFGIKDDVWSGLTEEQRESYRLEAGSTERHVRQGTVPDAPFKTTWPMLVMKRMIRAAAEGGYDRIAWTTGRQQAARYNLAEHVDSVQHRPSTSGHGYDVRVWGKDGRNLYGGEGISPEELRGVIGKDLTDSVVAGKGEPSERKSSWRNLRGEDLMDLEFGGQGQKGFYDDILPRETNKLIRKYGAEVGSTSIKADNAPEDIVERYATEDPDHPFVQKNRMEVHSFDITPEMREQALSQGFPMFWKKPSQQTLGLQQGQRPRWYEGVRRAVEYLHSNPVTKDLRKLINPTKLSEEAKRTAVLARAALGNLAHSTFETQEHLEQFSRQIDRLKPEEQLEMMDAIEHGVPQPNADLQPVADALRKQLDTWRDRVRGLGTGALDNFIENYFPHYWSQPGQAQRMVATIMGRRPLRGPASFLKMRTIPTIKEGMDAGLTPLTINPLVMTLLKVREMQRFISGVKMMQEFKDAGLARFLPATKPMPDGWAEIKDNIAKVRQWSEEEQGFIERGRYIMPEDGARLINNHVGRSVLTDFAPTHVLRLGGNLLNAMQLGFSAFHLGFTTLDASISKNALGIEQLLRGEVGRAASSFAQGFTPVGAVANVTRGYKLMRAYADPAGATPEMARIVSALQSAGGRVAMDRYFMAIQGVNPFRGVGVRSLVGDVRAAIRGEEPVKGVARAVANFPVEYATRAWRELQGMTQTMPKLQIPFEIAGRTVRASTAWIMEHLVPMQKLGVFSDMAQDYLRRNPTATSDQVARAMQSAWDSVDNRLGEMVYDNVFWNRTFKDANHLAVRAVGWNLGTIREIGGAPIDALRLVDKAMREGKISAEDVGHKIPYVLAMTATTAALGATLNYMFTGQGPQELKDYFFPRTGGTTNRGTPQRVSLPSYVKDVYEYSQHPSTTVANKLNPIFSVLTDIWKNEDYFGNPISEPEASPLAQAGQRAAYAVREATPFSIQGRAHIEGSDAEGASGVIKRALPFIGVTPAPGYVTSPDQIARRERYEAEDKYSRELNFKLKKAIQAKDQDQIDSLKEQYIQSRRRVKELEMQMKMDKAKAAAARRQNATSMRQQGFPATAGLLAALPLEPDQAAREYFRRAAGAA